MMMAIGNLDEEVVCDTKDGEDDGNGDEEDGDEGQVQALGLLCNGAGAGAALIDNLPT